MFAQRNFWVPLSGAGGYAGEVDTLFIALLILTTLTAGLLFYLLIRFAFEYRGGSKANRAGAEEEGGGKSWHWEIGWTSASLVVFVGLAIWGADLFLRIYQPPDDAMQIYVVGKQWMWKTQHEGGQREINTLHVPVGRAVRLVMASEDVIHSFFLPSFRVKHDVVPGRYSMLWFRADKAGSYWLTCAEYCGTDHSRMGGRLIAMEPRDFAMWLESQPAADTLAVVGSALFRELGCGGCHRSEGATQTVRAPPLDGLFGRPVPLQDGSTITADEQYLRDSILDPGRHVVASYQNIMPSYAGKIDEDALVQLIAYLRMIGAPAARAAP